MDDSSETSLKSNLPPALYTVDEIAEYLRVPKNTVYYWCSRHEVPFIKCGRHVRFNPIEVLAYFSNKTKENRSWGLQLAIERRPRSPYARKKVLGAENRLRKSAYHIVKPRRLTKAED